MDKSITFEFPDYTCQELAKIYLDLAGAKGFDMDDDLSEDVIANLHADTVFFPIAV